MPSCPLEIGVGDASERVRPAASLTSTPAMITSDTTSETVAVTAAVRAADAATVVAGDRAAFEPTDPPGATLVRALAEPEQTDQTDPIDSEDSPSLGDDYETVLRSGAFRPQQPSGPAVVPTVIAPRPPPAHPPAPLGMGEATLPGMGGPKPVVGGGPKPMMGSGPLPSMRQSPLAGISALSAISSPHTRMATDPVHRRQPRRARVIGGLVAIAVLSFIIALTARGKAPATVAVDDAAIATTAPRDAQADAPPPIAVPDAAPIDARAPTIPPDADPTATAVLEIRTRPDGAMVKIGDQAHAAPTQLTLPAGHYSIDAELEGWMPERRTLDLAKGDRVVQEIVFTTELSDSAPPPQTGSLTVRTTPPCDVFLGTRRLTETPFTDMELAPGTYTLVFKHPKHKTVIRNVTITAGKATKLQVTLP